MDQPLVSIIVPVYNAAPWVGRCLDSLINQSYRQLEILVVSDGSTDQSDVIIAGYAEKDKRIRFTRQENQGVSAARNLGLASARGQWVCFVDADDYVSRHYVQTMVDAISSDTVDAVAVNFFMELPRGWRLPYPFVTLKKTMTGEEAIRQSFRLLFFPTFTWNKLFRRELFTRHGISFPPILYEDAFVVPLLFLHCRQVRSLKKPCYHYIRHPGSLTHRFSARHVRDYLTSATLLGRHLYASGDWDQWKKPFDRWLNRILTQIILTLFLSKGALSFRERDLLTRKSFSAVRRIKHNLDTELDAGELDPLI